MESASGAYNPRQTWAAEKQQAKGYDDEWARQPAAVYPWKRQQWFDVAFHREPAVRTAPRLGACPSHFRDGGAAAAARLASSRYFDA